MTDKPSNEEFERRVIVAHGNITERKQAEEKLRERLSFEKLLSRVSVLAMETDDLYLFQNKCLTAMGDTLHVSRIYIFEHHHETDTMDNTFEWVAEGVSPQNDELQGVRAIDIPWWMEVLKKNQVINFADIEDIPDEGAKAILRPQGILSILVVPLFTAGQYYGFLGFDDCVRHREWSDTDAELLQAVGRIITGAVEQKRAEKALKESEKFLDATGFVARVGGWQLDAETMALTWTKETYRIHKVPPDFKPTLGKLIEFFHPDDRKALSQAIQRALDRGDPYDMELQLTAANGNKLWTRTICRPEVVDGKTVRLQGTFQDITERKQAEAEREKLQTQLNQAQKMESIGTLAGGIAHDFNNILACILGFTQLELGVVEKGTEIEESLQEIFAAGTRAKDLVKQILTISRQDEKEIQPILITPLMKESLKMLRSTLPTSIEFQENICSDTLVVMADPTQLHQVVINLITNAKHSFADGIGVLEVGVDSVNFESDIKSKYPDMQPGKYALITVRDNGSGIPEKNLEKIFEPYFTTREKGEGTGLGLSVVHGIVKSHNGHITVYSEPGKGTTFHVYLPLAQKAASDQPDRPVEPLATGTEHILLIDDEPSITKFQQRYLERLGYKTTTETVSLHALETFRKSPDEFDLVITDMAMPKMTGEKLAEKMISIRSDIPVIICTGFSERINEQKAKAIGIKAFLMKPIGNRDLAKTIRKVLDDAQTIYNRGPCS